MAVITKPLCECPDLVGDVAKLLWSEFGENFSFCFSIHNEGELANYLRREYVDARRPLPSVVIYKELHGDSDVIVKELVGFANVVIDDIGRPWNQIVRYWPWLANVAVVRAERGKGYGRAMIKHLLSVLRKKEVDVVYLWTHTERLRDWYEGAFGFGLIDSIDNFSNHERIYIMKKEI